MLHYWRLWAFGLEISFHIIIISYAKKREAFAASSLKRPVNFIATPLTRKFITFFPNIYPLSPQQTHRSADELPAAYATYLRSKVNEVENIYTTPKTRVPRTHWQISSI